MEGRVAVRAVQDRDCRAPRLTHRFVTSRQPERKQMTHAFIAAVVYRQELSAPDRTVVAQPRAIPRYAKNVAGQVVLSHAREHMRVMVLNAYGRQAALQSKRCRPVIRM